MSARKPAEVFQISPSSRAAVEARKVQKAIDRTARLLGQQVKDEYLKANEDSQNLLSPGLVKTSSFFLPVKLLGEIRGDR